MFLLNGLHGELLYVNANFFYLLLNSACEFYLLSIEETFLIILEMFS